MAAMPKQRVFLRVLLLLFVLGCVAAVAAAWVIRRSDNVRYTVYELVYRTRFHQYDPIIEEVAKERGIDPMLVKSVVWRESRFVPGKVGLDKERGLMQITDAAAGEWVKGEKITNFVPGDLFDPKVNLRGGSWLLARGLRRYQDRDDPVPFALAEYNAGRSRVVRWAGDTEKEKEAGTTAARLTDSKEFLAKIEIADTRRYVETVMERMRFYHERGRL